MNTSYELSKVLGLEDPDVSKTDQNPYSLSIYIVVSKQMINNISKIYSIKQRNAKEKNNAGKGI